MLGAHRLTYDYDELAVDVLNALKVSINSGTTHAKRTSGTALHAAVVVTAEGHEMLSAGGSALPLAPGS